MEKELGIKFYSKEDLRFATPKEVAEFRARRLKCKRIADLCCGIGAQTFAFSKTCENVVGVEIDKRKTELARKNCNSKNTEIIQGDVLSLDIFKKIKEFKPEIIFCDPERPENEKEREIKNIRPNLKKLIEIYSKICKNICIEIPPQIEKEKLNELGKFEAEYLSCKNKLNRLNIYFGDLAESEVSVVDISGVKIKKANAKAEHTKKVLNYLYEASTAIKKAGLENELAQESELKILSEEGKLLLTSEKSEINKFSKAFTKIYKIIGISEDKKEIIKILKKNYFGKVVLKTNVSPENYWAERNEYENELNGNKDAVLFLLKDKFIIGEEIK